MTNEENFILCKTNSNWFANGWQVYRRGDGAFHHFGDWLMDKDHIKVEIPLVEVGLEWMDLKQPHKPTLFEKFKALFGVHYPEIDYVRPNRFALVVVDYDGLIEVAEASPNKDGSACTWITELNSYMIPKRWAYIPDNVLNNN